MERCQQKAIHMQNLKNQYGLVRDELNFSKEKIENLERDEISLIKDMSDNEYYFQEFVIPGYNIIKLASMIYGVSKSK